MISVASGQFAPARFASAALAAALLGSVAMAAPAEAQVAKGSQGTGDAQRSAGFASDLAGRKVVKKAPPKLEAGEESRAAMPDVEALKQGFKTRSISKAGSVTDTPAPEALKTIIESEATAPSGAEAGGAPEGAADPAAGANRQVFGNDDRVQITDTQDYPFRVIGQLWSQYPNGDWSTCTATLIGPKTVITAAHCLYDNESKSWLQNFEFYPGLNGASDAPYGKYGYETASILEGFQTNYQGYYGSVVPWDLGVVVLDGAAGTDLGWLGYSGSDRMSSFKANIVGYPGDKEQGTMWQATCDASAKNADQTNFAYDCDTFPGSSGSSVYKYDEKSDERTVLGVNIAESPDSNTALRLNRSYFNWVQSLVQ